MMTLDNHNWRGVTSRWRSDDARQPRRQASVDVVWRHDDAVMTWRSTTTPSSVSRRGMTSRWRSDDARQPRRRASVDVQLTDSWPDTTVDATERRDAHPWRTAQGFPTHQARRQLSARQDDWRRIVRQGQRRSARRYWRTGIMRV